MRFYRGLIIVKPHGSWIISGEKPLLVKSIRLKHVPGKLLLLIESKRALGIIKLGEPRPITLKQFRRLRSKHKITEKERLKWWKGRKLYAYDIKIIKKFKKPRKINYPQGPQVVVRPKLIRF